MQRAIIILLLGIGVASCATHQGTGTAVGAGGGALIGGLAGGTTGMLIGAGVGGVLGYVVGTEMDRRDREQFAIAMEQNRQAEWRNANTGHVYEVAPGQTFQRGGRECRRYRMTADVEGRPDHINGTACRNPNGTWETI